MNQQIHQVSVEQVYRLLHSRDAGLSTEEVAERAADLGPNLVASRHRHRAARLLFKQFTNFFSLLLDVAAVFCFIAHHVQPDEGMLLMGWALLGVSTLNALFSFLQEARAERAMAALARLLPQTASVIRNAKEQDVLVEELVAGDVIVVTEGMRVPADARVVSSDDLVVNNAPLTGESRPVALTTDPTEGRLVDSTNICLMGCSVLRGRGRAIVFATGRRTEFGKIATLSEDVPRPVSPLERQTRHMVRVLTLVAVIMGATFFLIGVARGRPLWVNLVFMLGIVVANVPEGLLPTFTLALSIGATRLARRQVLVKSLSAVEALGSVQVICTDKTGTLTQNRLSISRVAGALDGAELPSSERRALLFAALVSSDVRYREEGLFGDPLDVAVARAYGAVGEDAREVSTSKRRHLAFDAVKRRSGGVHERGGTYQFGVKGAWEVLQSRCEWVRDASGRHAATTEAKRQVDETVENLASRGYRVVSVLRRDLASTDATCSQEQLERGLELLGLVCLEDPIRPEVPAAVEACRGAGIDVVMVTGDHAQTAEAIARESRILPENSVSESTVMTGATLERLRLEQVSRAIRAGVRVFARTTPEQKLKIVSALQRMQLTVAMTGDGVNDAPALRAADVGVAMGMAGTDVAREAAQVVLLDDNFASIVSGVEEGRTIFDNLKKFTNYVLVSNGPEIIPYLLYIVLPVPLALTIVQILCIDLGTDILPSMALGQEKPDEQVLKRPPRSRSVPLLSFDLVAHSYLFLGLFEAAYSLSLFFMVLVEGGWSYGQPLDAGSVLYRSATGLTLSSIMLMQIGNFCGRRSATRSGLDRSLWKNPLTLIGFGFEAIASYCVLYVPAVNHLLGTAPVAGHYYALAWLGAPLIFLVDYARKRVQWPKPKTMLAAYASNSPRPPRW